MTRAAASLALLLLAAPAFAQGTTATSSAADGVAGPQGQAGARGDTGSTGPAGTPKRVERYTATTTTGGIATFSWPACASAADVQVVPAWNGDQYVGGGVTSQTLSGATVQVMISRGTLLLTAGPFAAAGAGVSSTIRIICN